MHTILPRTKSSAVGDRGLSPHLSPWAIAYGLLESQRAREALGSFKVSVPGMVLNILAKKVTFLEYPGILKQ